MFGPDYWIDYDGLWDGEKYTSAWDWEIIRLMWREDLRPVLSDIAIEVHITLYETPFGDGYIECSPATDLYEYNPGTTVAWGAGYPPGDYVVPIAITNEFRRFAIRYLYASHAVTMIKERDGDVFWTNFCSQYEV